MKLESLMSNVDPNGNQVPPVPPVVDPNAATPASTPASPAVSSWPPSSAQGASGGPLVGQSDAIGELSVDELNLAVSLLTSLKSAGVMTVGQVEEALKDEKAFQGKVHGLGPKTILPVRAAVEELRANASTGLRPHARTNPEKSKEKDRNGRNPVLWSALILFSGLGLVLILAFVSLLLLGSKFDEVQLYEFNALFAFITAPVIWVVIGKSRATVEGTTSGFTIKLGGAIAGSVVIFWGMTKMAPAIAPRMVYIYAARKLEPGELNGGKIDQFKVHYRGSHGPQTAVGQNGAAVAPNIPRDATDLEVNAIDCFGFIPVMQKAGKAPPWKYSIIGSTVDIEMAKKLPADDAMPEAEQVRAMIKEVGLTEEKIRAPGKFDKKLVSLTIENAADRPIAFVAADCVAALAPEALVVDGKLWSLCRDKRGIQPGDRVTWGNFAEFGNPSGWFALFVRYEDGPTNRIIQRPIGVYNLFQVREPKVVIERKDDAPGVHFQLGAGSKMEE